MADGCWRYGKGDPRLKPHTWRPYPTQTRWDWEECRHCGRTRNVSRR